MVAEDRAQDKQDKKSAETQRGAAARALVRSLDRAALATAMTGNGTPYASLVMTACDPTGSPLLLLSDLAEHTSNLKADHRASLLYDATGGLDNPLTGTRATLVGSIDRLGDPALAARYLARYLAHHPDAEAYAGFADFNLYRMRVERVHVVAGFGEINWLPAEAFLAAARQVAELTDAERDIVAHMNDDHADAVGLYATILCGASGGAWRLAAIDCDGIDLRLGAERARVAFEQPVFTPDEARKRLASLVQRARKMAENQSKKANPERLR